MYSKELLEKFLEDLGSKNSTPGGGSAAALSGALAASVVKFIANLTIGKKKYLEVEPDAREILNEATTLEEELLKMMDEDSEILNEILECYKKGDKEELLAISKKAVGFSLEMTRKCVQVMHLAYRISAIGNRMLASDFEVAAFLGDAAVNSAIANVKINLKGIKEEEFVSEVETEYASLQEKSAKLKEEILENA